MLALKDDAVYLPQSQVMAPKDDAVLPAAIILKGQKVLKHLFFLQQPRVNIYTPIFKPHQINKFPK